MKSTFQTILLIVFGFVAVVGVLMFAGIIPGGATFSGKKTAGTAVVWGPYLDPAVAEYFGKLSDAYSSTVKFRYEARDPETYESDLIEAFARGEGPDVFFVTQKMLPRLAGKTISIPEQTYSERDFRSSFVEGAEIFKTSSGLAAMPLYVDPLVMYYNRAMYSSAGIVNPPATWKDFVATLKPINAVDDRNNVTRTAAALGEFRNVTNAKPVVSLLVLQAGNPITAAKEGGNYESVLSSSFGADTKPAEAALSFYLQFANPAQTTYSWNRSVDNDKDMFAAENLAAYFGFGSELSNLRERNPHLDLDVAVVPQSNLLRRTTYGNFYGLAIAKNTKQIAAASQAMFVLASPKEDKALADILSYAPLRREPLAQGDPDPFRQVFYDSALVARSWVDPSPDRTDQIFQAMIENSQTGRVAPGDAVDDASNRINSLFGNN